MARTSHPVFWAIKRWQDKGLLSADLADSLRAETEEELRQESQRWSQYLLAATGGAVLIIAASTFLAWAWPGMGPGAQALSLGVMGLGVLALGLRIPSKGRLAPVGYLLQLAGPILIFMAMVHSKRAWDDGTLGGVVMGLSGLVVALGVVWISLRKAVVMAALQASMAFLFLYGFLDRSLTIPDDAILWILDGLLVVALAVAGARLKDPEAPEWALPMFASFLLTGMVLLLYSGSELWRLDALTIIPMDIWLILVAALAYWGLQEDAPAHLRRDWFEYVLALCILVGIPFGFITSLEALDANQEVTALMVGAVGGMGLWYSIPRRSRVVLAAGCLALLLAAWYYGAERGGALGSVVALAVMAGILFWGASRMGSSPPETPSAG
jgi:hypothetical protein